MKINLSIRLRIVLYSGIVVLLTAGILSGVAYFNSARTSEDLVATTLTSKLEGDINSFEYYIDHYFGTLDFEDGTLTDQNGDSIAGNHALVDAIRDDKDVIATIFAREGDDFRRITTNVMKPDGSRAVGTMLGSDSAAYDPVMRGQLFIGRAEILGVPYLTAYDPIFGEARRVVGIAFVGVRMAEANAIVALGQREMLSGLAIALILVAAAGLTVIYIAASIIVSPIKKASAMLKDIAQGEGAMALG